MREAAAHVRLSGGCGELQVPGTAGRRPYRGTGKGQEKRAALRMKSERSGASTEGLEGMAFGFYSERSEDSHHWCGTAGLTFQHHHSRPCMAYQRASRGARTEAAAQARQEVKQI